MLEAGQNIITRHLPKTGQVISYAAGDDGDHEAGWWRGRTNASNKNRWIVKTISGGAIVVDRATGLMWPYDWQGPGANNGIGGVTWFYAISWANGLNFAGFTDWRLPNINELHSIIEFVVGSAPYIYQPPFTNVRAEPYWSSTTYPPSVGLGMCMRVQYGLGSATGKTSPGFNCYTIAVRECRV